MLTFKRFHKYGRIGNQLWELSFLIMMRIKHGIDYQIPKWDYAKFFKGDFHEVDQISEETIEAKEPKFEYSPEYVADLKNRAQGASVDVVAYVQSVKYWWDIKEQILDYLEFTDDILETVRPEMDKYLQTEIDGSYRNNCAIHLRFGDYVGNDNYVQLTPAYYLSLIDRIKQDNPSVKFFIFSDDEGRARFHFKCLPDVSFEFGKMSEIEHLAVMSHCDYFILANSSYSFWGAFLAQRNCPYETTVYYPDKVFNGRLATQASEVDMWPPDWTPWPIKAKVVMRDCTFIIPITYDSEDRYENYKLVVKYLRHYFDTNIIIGEHGAEAFKQSAANNGCEYMHWTGEHFHRTRFLNDMTEAGKTKYVCNLDADVLFTPAQIFEAVRMLRNGLDLVYPYDEAFVRLDRKKWYDPIRKSLSLDPLLQSYDGGSPPGYNPSVGGAVFFEKDAYWRMGGENENFVSFGPEDACRYRRAKVLGLKIGRVVGKLYHMNHWCGENSSSENDNFERNENEWKRVKYMTKKELREYVNSWLWVRK